MRPNSMSGHAPPETFIHKLLGKKYVFAGVFTLIFFLSLSLLSLFRFGPEVAVIKPGDVGPITGPASEYLPKGEGAVPMRVEIPAVGVRANINNPAKTDVASLDQALLTGAVRYPGSALLGEEGNVLLFGHSSYLPVVHNQSYRAFNEIQKLKAGDPIYILSEDKVFIYAVESVEEANTATGEIPLSVSGAKLTLATCDTFGAKSDRFIVTASFVRSQPLEGQGS
jgi:LPXTG-site transpeptidase (sortase) family protein